MKIYKDLTALIGQTPLVELYRDDAGTVVAGKAEFFNPAGSVKDRAAKFMIEEAEASGFLSPGAVIIEPTSGNTGIGLAAIAAARGYRVILTMPETMSVERRNLLKAYGAEVVLTEGAKGMQGAIDKAHELADAINNSFLPGQFTNAANPKAHFETTGPEIWADTEGKIDIFVAGVGTGGTISGVGAFLKSQNPDIRIIAVEPADSPVLSQGKAGGHQIQGIGAGFVPETFDRSICDEIMTIQNEEALTSGRELAQKQGLLVGISAGAAFCAARKLAQKAEYVGQLIVTLLPDTGERYLSTAMFL